MSQSQRPQSPIGTRHSQNRRTDQAQSLRLTTPNILIGVVLALILLFVVMSVFSIGPFSWGN